VRKSKRGRVRVDPTPHPWLRLVGAGHGRHADEDGCVLHSLLLIGLPILEEGTQGIVIDIRVRGLGVCQEPLCEGIVCVAPGSTRSRLGLGGQLHTVGLGPLLDGSDRLRRGRVRHVVADTLRSRNDVIPGSEGRRVRGKELSHGLVAFLGRSAEPLILENLGYQRRDALDGKATRVGEGRHEFILIGRASIDERDEDGVGVVENIGHFCLLGRDIPTIIVEEPIEGISPRSRASVACFFGASLGDVIGPMASEGVNPRASGLLSPFAPDRGPTHPGGYLDVGVRYSAQSRTRVDSATRASSPR